MKVKVAGVKNARRNKRWMLQASGLKAALKSVLLMKQNSVNVHVTIQFQSDQ